MKDCRMTVKHGIHQTGTDYPKHDFSATEQVYTARFPGPRFVAYNEITLKSILDELHTISPGTSVGYMYMTYEVKEVEAPLKHANNCGWYSSIHNCAGPEICNKHQGHAPDCSWHQDWHSCAGPEFCNKQKAVEPESMDD